MKWITSYPLEQAARAKTAILESLVKLKTQAGEKAKAGINQKNKDSAYYSDEIVRKFKERCTNDIMAYNTNRIVASSSNPNTVTTSAGTGTAWFSAHPGVGQAMSATAPKLVWNFSVEEIENGYLVSTIGPLAKPFYCKDHNEVSDFIINNMALSKLTNTK